MDILCVLQKLKSRKRLKVKLEMAKFLQDTLEEMALERKGAKGETAQEFVNFMNEVGFQLWLICSFHIWVSDK